MNLRLKCVNKKRDVGDGGSPWSCLGTLPASSYQCLLVSTLSLIVKTAPAGSEISIYPYSPDPGLSQ